MEVKSRNQTLDVVKLIASFLVVFIHVPFGGVAGDVVKALARVAVPVFFITSGFFCCGNDSKTICRKIYKLLAILLFASCLYNLTNIGFGFLSGGMGAVRDYLSKFLDGQKWFRLLVFNLPFSATRLWFLFALIYVYLLQLAVNRLHLSHTTLLVLAAGGLMVHILLGSKLVGVPDYVCRNFLLMGYPFFALGMVLRRYENVLSKVTLPVAGVCFGVGCLLSLSPLVFETTAQISVGTLVMVFAVFALALRRSEVQYPKFVGMLCKCSLGIYVLHRPVTTVTAIGFGFLGIREGSVLHGLFLPIAVCILTAALTLLLMRLQRRKKH